VRRAIACWLLITSCSLDRSGLVDPIGQDAGRSLDAGMTMVGDAGMPIDGGRDAGPIVLPDAGNDAGRDAGPPLSPCARQYMDVPRYMPCDERPGECEFSAQLDMVRSCASTCEERGGSCLGAWRNEDDTPFCQRCDPAECTGMQVDNICICSRDLE
jgi:hypothetical protein